VLLATTYRKYTSRRLRRWRTSIGGLPYLAFSAGRFQSVQRRDSKERFLDMTSVSASSTGFTAKYQLEFANVRPETALTRDDWKAIRAEALARV
jgi:hypothetical protein